MNALSLLARTAFLAGGAFLGLGAEAAAAARSPLNSASSVSPAPAERRLPAAQLRRNLVRVAEAEWRDFGRPRVDLSTGAARVVSRGAQEGDTAWQRPVNACPRAQAGHRAPCAAPPPFDASTRVARYWQEALPAEYGDRFAGMDANTRSAWVSSNAQPWSAVFISYLLRQVGAGDRFPYSAAHSAYLRGLVQRGATVPEAQFEVLLATETRLRTGDLLCAPRDGDDNPQTLQLPVLETLADLARMRRAHCDVVVALQPRAGWMDLIGGNVENTVAKSRAPLTRSGLAVQILDRPWFFVVRVR